MTRFNLIVLLLLCLPLFVSCKDNRPAAIKRALIQEQQQYIELRIKRHASVQEKILACKHHFNPEISQRCTHCGIYPNDFVNKRF